MKIYYGGVLIAAGLILAGKLATLPDDTSSWIVGVWAVTILNSFGWGFKYSADYIIDKIRKPK